MASKLEVSRKAYNCIVGALRENGSMSTKDGIELIKPYYDSDPRAVRKREIWQYLDLIVRSIRNAHGVRSAFLDEVKSEIVNIDTCKDPVKLTAVEKQLKAQVVDIYQSHRKAVKRRRDVKEQRALFDFTNVVSEPRQEGP